MKVFYNDIEPFACAWLSNLMDDGLITPGKIDDRSIANISADDVRGYDRVHWFAGVGCWDLALNLAGWGNRPVWSGSCPCPPFSSAGKKKPCPQCGGSNPVPCPRRTGYFICCLCGHAWLADARHLWPELWRLIAECQPHTFIGEQVPSADGRVWLAAVRASLEILGYAVGAADLPAAGVGAFHKRQRLWFVAHAQRGTAERSGLNMGGATVAGSDRSREQRVRLDTGNGSTTYRGDGLAVTANPHRGSGERRTKAGVGPGGERRRGFAGGSTDGVVQDDTASARLDGAGQGPEAETRDKTRVRGPERGCGEDRPVVQDDPSSIGGEARLPEQGCGNERLPEVADDGGDRGTGRTDRAPAVAQGDRLIPGLEGHSGDVGNGHEPGRDGTLETGSTPAAGALDGRIALGNPEGGGRRECGDPAQPGGGGHAVSPSGTRVGQADPSGAGTARHTGEDGGSGDAPRPEPHGSGTWADAIWLPCRDLGKDGRPKARPVPAQSRLLVVVDDGELRDGMVDGGTKSTSPEEAEGERVPDMTLFPLTESAPNRVGMLRGAGNAIVPKLAATFIRAYMDVVGINST